MTDSPSVGELEVPAPPQKPQASEVFPPQPKPINYQDQSDRCKACGLPAGVVSPLLVLKMITPREGGAFVSEHYAHVACVGMIVQIHTRSLFQIKLRNED